MIRPTPSSIRILKLNTIFLRTSVTAFFCAATVLTLVQANPAIAQTPARPDKIMTIAELRSCMKLEQANKKTAEEIVQEQEAFKRDQAAVKAEQAEVSKANDEVRARQAVLGAERDTLSAEANAFSAKVQVAKTDAEKADLGLERLKLVERNRLYDQSVERSNATQQALRDRITALNVQIDAINLRNKTINDRVEPHQEQVIAWRQQCSKRRFREEDEIAIKKEFAAGK